MLSYREFAPHPRLASLIQCSWVLRQDEAAAEPQRVVPDGHPELILNLGTPFQALRDTGWHPQPQHFLAGQIEGPLLLRSTGPAHVLGIRFHPHAAALFFGPAMHELAGRFTPLATLSPNLQRACERALDHPDPLRAFQHELLNPNHWRPPDPKISATVQRLIDSRGSANLAQIARDLNLSLRQFERRFLASVGLPPKLFCRMQRFVHVFHRISDPAASWIDAALDCGYYDQSHLIRDCKRLSGHTPAALVAPGADLARHFYQRFGMSHSSKTISVASR